MEKAKHVWKRAPKPVRQSLVLIVGTLFILGGIAGLILPIIPGWAGIFVGFAILATEFAFAEKLRDRTVHFLKQAAKRAQELWRNVRKRR